MVAARRAQRLVRRRRPPQWHLLLSGSLLLIAVVVGVYLSTNDHDVGDVDLLSANPAPVGPPHAVTASQFASRLHADIDSPRCASMQTAETAKLAHYGPRAKPEIAQAPTGGTRDQRPQHSSGLGTHATEHWPFPCD